jgi:Tfp pilus assembly protein PilF
VRRNVNAAEVEYKKAIESNPNNADALGNYASFLHGVHKKIDEAEKYYKLAVDLDDTHANNLCNFGLFLR